METDFALRQVDTGFEDPNIYLNDQTPPGLFVACKGNKYIVTDDFDCRVAIALVHRTLQPFTWQFLDPTPLEYGRSRAGYELLLTQAVPRKRISKGAGIIGTQERYADIDC